MTVVDILGAGGRQFLRQLLANDIDNLKLGNAMYSCMLNQHGGVMDDLIVYHRCSDSYRLVLNAATRIKDLSWIEEKAKGFAVGLLERHELAILAIQGPKAIEKTLKSLSEEKMDAVSTLGPFQCIDSDDWFIARTGYTGEDGLEFIVPQEHLVDLWGALVANNVLPCGLGARDSLRLEAGMLLYGQDMDETTTPLESGLAWTVKLDDNERDFIGRGALLAQKQYGLVNKLVGLVLDTKGILRRGQKIIIEGIGEGVITSGGYSPTLGKSIALARVPLATQKHAMVEIRGKKLAVNITNPRFFNKK
jgi:aminomethyltransferase